MKSSVKYIDHSQSGSKAASKAILVALIVIAGLLAAEIALRAYEVLK